MRSSLVTVLPESMIVMQINGAAYLAAFCVMIKRFAYPNSVIIDCLLLLVALASSLIIGPMVEFALICPHDKDLVKQSLKPGSLVWAFMHESIMRK